MLSETQKPLEQPPAQGSPRLGKDRLLIEEMVLCLADVVARIPKNARISYLSDKQNAELLNWDAEKYRQSLATAR